jgi:hypothetical protein
VIDRTGLADQDSKYMYIPEQDRQNGTGIAGQAQQDRHSRTGRRERQNWADETGHAEQVKQKRKLSTGQVEQDSENKTGRTKQA